MNKILLILSILFISNTASAISLGDLKKELEKTGDKLKKELENNNQDSSGNENTKKKMITTKILLLKILIILNLLIYRNLNI